MKKKILTKPCIHCGEEVKGFMAEEPLFQGAQWGIHVVSDKFSCADGIHTAEVELDNNE